jgi:4-hydroxy-tetrahydrodipicolinate synthase
MSLTPQLIGTGVALVTPFTQNQAVDFDALGRVIDHVINGGVEYSNPWHYRRNPNFKQRRKV